MVGVERVLITAANVVTSMNVVRALAQTGRYEVYTADMTPYTPLGDLVQGHVVVPRGADPSYAAVVLKHALDLGVTTVFPISDFELRPLARARQLFREQGIAVIVPSEKTLDICYDKLETSIVAQRLGLAVPHTVPVAHASPCPLPYPVMFRPRIVGRKKKFNLAIRSELDWHYAQSQLQDEAVVSEFIPGEEYSMDTLSDASGKTIFVAPRKRAVVIGGISYVGEIVNDPELIRQTSVLLDGVGMQGIACVQCIKDAAGVYRFIEINPRAGGGLGVTITAGANLPDLCIRSQAGESVSVPPVPSGYRAIRTEEWRSL